MTTDGPDRTAVPAGLARAGVPSRLVGEILLLLYRGFGHAVAPLLPLLFARRARRGKEDAGRRGERFGRASRPRPDGPLVWLHAASVGEMNASRPLVRALRRRGLVVLMTTGTVTSARIAAAEADPGVIHQFVPYDTPPGIGRFLDHWRPDLAITAESEIWPTTISTLARRDIPLAIASATMSPRSAAGWRRMRPFARTIFSRIPLCLAQTAEDAERLRELGAPQVEVCGNLKFDGGDLPVDASALDALTQALGGRPVWLAASTHEGEETLVAEVHEALRGDLPGLLTVIVPRHPERGAAIAAALEARGLRLTQRSQGLLPDPDCDIYLGDTIGEMGLYYRVAPVAFIGKSLVPEGGQNPLEAARLGAAIVTGPHVFNLLDIYTPLFEAEGAAIVRDAGELADAVRALLGDRRLASERAAIAADVAKAGRGALDASLAALAPLLPPARDTDR